MSLLAYMVAKLCTFVKSSTDQPLLIFIGSAHKTAFLAVHRFFAIEGPNGHKEEGETIPNFDLIDGGRSAVGHEPMDERTMRLTEGATDAMMPKSIDMG